MKKRELNRVLPFEDLDVLLCKKSWTLWSLYADPGVEEMRLHHSCFIILVMRGTSVAHLITLSLDFHIHRKGIHVAQCYSDTQ